MPNRTQVAIARHAERQKQQAGVPITYTRGAYSVDLTAVPGKTDAQLADTASSRVRTEWVDKDYLIVAAELVLDGSVITPAAGDQITDGVEVREVAPVNAEPPARPSDTYGIRHRVHTKRVA